jgi:chemotaxis protein methyltransferase CheR
MTPAFASLAELVRQETGIVLSATREKAVLAAVDRAAPGLGPSGFVRAASDPAGGRGLVDQLIDQVTVRETTFVRDRAQLDAIGWHGLLEAARAAGSDTIRVWSAGCASGEEAYTLALLATEAFTAAPPPVDVLGTDISGAALAAARAGHYRERAVRGLAARERSRYLDRQADDGYLVGAGLRSLVRFGRHNLVRDPAPPPGEAGFDLITCRNVLIYFSMPLAGQVIESLERALRPGGQLLLGAADALQRPPGRSPGPALAATRSPRRPLRREGPASRQQVLTAALDAAGHGDRGGALAHVAAALADDPLDADAHFIDGLIRLEAGDAARAATALRRALYADQAFALAAFTLGRAYDSLGDTAAARRSYEQALRTLDPADGRHDGLLQQVDIGDIAAACSARLRARPGDP